MDEMRAAVYTVAGFILLVTLVSGPLVGLVDLTHEPPGCDAPLGSGSATITVESLPDRATISKGQFGADTYYLDVPDGAVTVSNVSGQPLLAYDLSIRELGLSVGPTLFLCSGQSPSQSLTIQRLTLDEAEIQADSYDATLTLVLRGDGAEVVVREKPITVEVES